MDVSRWSEAAANNGFGVPDGAPEGWNPSDVNDWGREVMAAAYRWYEGGEWIDITWALATYGEKFYTRLSDTQFKILGCNATVTVSGKPGFAAGRRVRFVSGISVYDGFITAASYSAPDTTVTVALDSGVLPVGWDVALLHHSTLGRVAHLLGVGVAGQEVGSDGVKAAFTGIPMVIGSIAVWPTASPPAGWLLCGPAAVSRATYAALFALIGTTYGAGDGSTTFNLPNMRARVVVGRDAAQTEFDVLGETGGAKEQNYFGSGGTSPSQNGNFATPSNSHVHLASALQPYITLNFIIRYQ